MKNNFSICRNVFNSIQLYPTISLQDFHLFAKIFPKSSVEDLMYCGKRCVCWRQWYNSRALASHTKGPGFESRDERVLPLGFFHTNGVNTGYVSRKQTSSMINISLKLVLTRLNSKVWPRWSQITRTEHRGFQFILDINNINIILYLWHI